jgi:tetratricopeptide (TPR) repeat protein
VGQAEKLLDASERQVQPVGEKNVRFDTLEIRGKRSDARKLIDQALLLDLNSSRAHRALGIYWFEVGRSPEAIEEFLRATRLDPTDSQSFCDLGSGYLNLYKLDDARRAYQQALTLDKSTSNVLALNGLGRVAYLKGDIKSALDWYGKGRDADPGDAVSWYNIGYARYKGLHDLDGAELAYRQATVGNPEHMGGGTTLDAYNSLGVVLMHKGKISDAEAAFRKALTIVPCDPIVANDLAIALGGQAAESGSDARAINCDEALRVYREEIANCRPGVQVYRNFGMFLWKQKRFEEAAAQFRLAVQLLPDDPKSLASLAILSEAEGKHDEAKMFRKRAEMVGVVDFGDPSAQWVARCPPGSSSGAIVPLPR